MKILTVLHYGSGRRRRKFSSGSLTTGRECHGKILLSVRTYGAETRTFQADDKRRIDASRDVGLAKDAEDTLDSATNQHFNR